MLRPPSGVSSTFSDTMSGAGERASFGWEVATFKPGFARRSVPESFEFHCPGKAVHRVLVGR